MDDRASFIVDGEQMPDGRIPENRGDDHDDECRDDEKKPLDEREKTADVERVAGKAEHAVEFDRFAGKVDGGEDAEVEENRDDRNDGEHPNQLILFHRARGFDFIEIQADLSVFHPASPFLSIRLYHAVRARAIASP
ncbi:MAG: hypothetical protein MZU97_06755 [Bacillus subtilis]|nr:hypothetical protein [Bacillus subtilis]